jgi:hypothetical protein
MERAMDAATLVLAGRWAIGIGLASGGLLCFNTAYALRDHQPYFLILLLGLICIAAITAFMWRGLKILPVVAVAGFVGALLATLMTGGSGAIAGQATPFGSFYRAILLEQAAAWTTLLILATALLSLERKAQRQ